MNHETPILKILVRSGSVVLDSTRYWLIRKADVKAEWLGGKEKGTLRIVSEFKEGFPFVKRQVMHVSCPKARDGKPVEDEWVWDLDFHQITGTDEKQFTLSAFGLPEPEVKARATPVGTPEKSSRLLPLVSLVAAVTCVIIFVRRRLVARRVKGTNIVWDTQRTNQTLDG